MSPSLPLAGGVAALTILGWNGVFLATAESGVLGPIAGFAGLMAGFVLVVRRRDLGRWFQITPGGVAAGIGLGLLLSGLSWWAWLAAQHLPLDLEPAVAHLYAVLRKPPGPVLGLPLVVLTITAEEVIFRGLLQDALRPRLGSVQAVLAVAALYVLANLGSGTWVLPVAAGLLGVIWGALAERTGGLVVPLLCHLVWDLVVMVALPLVPG